MKLQKKSKPHIYLGVKYVLKTKNCKLLLFPRENLYILNLSSPSESENEEVKAKVVKAEKTKVSFILSSAT